MRLNTAVKSREITHEGGRAFGHLSPEQRLRRSLMSCLLWEREFYEDGVSIADRLAEAAKACKPETVAALALEARSTFNLRHAPLLLLSVLAETGAGKPGLVSSAVESVIQRADELTELLAIYWRNGRKPLPAQFKKGLAKAFQKFDAYRLAKYNRDGAIKLRDVLFLVHAKPKDAEQAAVWKRLVDGTLEAPDTWEVSLSGGKDKRETFERLLKEGQLGYLALLRNLRNMSEAGVDEGLVRDAILARVGAKRVLPFRYVAAARAAPRFEPYIDQALSEAISEAPALSGKTVVLVDVSGSMSNRLSSKSDLTRMDAAAALASIVHGDIRVFTFSQAVAEVPPRRGMAGIDAVIRSQPHGGTYLAAAVDWINRNVQHDRIIVVTDEQSHDGICDPVAKDAYLINVASYQNGVGYGRWTHIDGFSEAVLRFIAEHDAAATS
jgi:60 kDa SS-A/Ro ribonucleoprotein